VPGEACSKVEAGIIKLPPKACDQPFTPDLLVLPPADIEDAELNWAGVMVKLVDNNWRKQPLPAVHSILAAATKAVPFQYNSYWVKAVKLPPVTAVVDWGMKLKGTFLT